MNRIDIKLAIDMVVNAEENLFAGEADHLINTLEKCGNTLAAQATVILKLREALMTVKPHVQCDPYAVVIRALSIPDDSAQVLKEWLDNVMGEPVAWMADDEDGVCEFVESYFVEMAGGQLPFPNSAEVTPLFRKPAL